MVAARQALIQAFAFGWNSPTTSTLDLMTVIQSSPRGNIGRIVDGTIISVIIGEVERQPLVSKSWLKSAYGCWDESLPPGNLYRKNVEGWLLDWFFLWIRMQIEKGAIKPPAEEKKQLFERMVIAAITDYLYRAKTANGLYDPPALQQALSANSSQVKNWHRDYQPAWERLLTFMNELDRRSLGPIASKVKIINDDEEAA